MTEEAGMSAGPAAIESSLNAFSSRLTGSQAQFKRGSILIRFTDTGEEYSIAMTSREARMTNSAPPAVPLVEVSGPSRVLLAIMDGTQEPRRAFMAGGIRVQGDLPYLEALLKESGLLECG
jgi:putative sterol carrier protein